MREKHPSNIPDMSDALIQGQPEHQHTWIVIAWSYASKHMGGGDGYSLESRKATKLACSTCLEEKTL